MTGDNFLSLSFLTYKGKLALHNTQYTFKLFCYEDYVKNITCLFIYCLFSSNVSGKILAHRIHEKPYKLTTKKVNINKTKQKLEIDTVPKLTFLHRSADA